MHICIHIETKTCILKVPGSCFSCSLSLAYPRLSSAVAPRACQQAHRGSCHVWSPGCKSTTSFRSVTEGWPTNTSTVFALPESQRSTTHQSYLHSGIESAAPPTDLLAVVHNTIFTDWAIFDSQAAVYGDLCHRHWKTKKTRWASSAP